MSNKTLLFTLEYPPFRGGVGNYYYNLVKHYPESEDIFVLNNNKNNLINNKLPFLKWLPAFFYLNKEIKKNKINYIVVGNILPLGTVVYLLSRIKRIKYSVIIHGTDIMYTQKNKRKRRLAYIILKNSKKIICNSSYNQNLLNKLYKKEFEGKIKVINPGVNEEVKVKENIINGIKKKYKLKNQLILFTICRLIKRKGVDIVIKSIPEISKQIPNLLYFIAGDGEDGDFLKNLKNNLSPELRDKIIFLGAISEDDKWAWLSLSDIFVLPTREDSGNIEGFGIVYLEANLLAKPVIGGDSGGVGDAIRDGETGFLVNPNSQKDIVERIIFLARNKDQRLLLGKEGRERVLDNFLWKKQADCFYKIINQ